MMINSSDAFENCNEKGKTNKKINKSTKSLEILTRDIKGKLEVK